MGLQRPMRSRVEMIAALFVMPDGPYAGRENVDLWDEARNARGYPGPFPIVAHPPCARWGRWWWKGSAGERYERPGMDGGLFEAALALVHRYGGVLEHPAGSLAWPAFDLPVPPAAGGWVRHPPSIMPRPPGWACHVEQGRYGHRAPKPTWLYCVGETQPPALLWGDGGRDHGIIIAEGGSRQSICTRLSRRNRTLTPASFADELIHIARR